MDAGESLLKLVDEEVYMSGLITAWISGECIYLFVFMH